MNWGRPEWNQLELMKWPSEWMSRESESNLMNIKWMESDGWITSGPDLRCSLTQWDAPCNGATPVTVSKPFPRSLRKQCSWTVVWIPHKGHDNLSAIWYHAGGNKSASTGHAIHEETQQPAILQSFKHIQAFHDGQWGLGIIYHQISGWNLRSIRYQAKGWSSSPTTHNGITQVNCHADSFTKQTKQHILQNCW